MRRSRQGDRHIPIHAVAKQLVVILQVDFGTHRSRFALLGGRKARDSSRQRHTRQRESIDTLVFVPRWTSETSRSGTWNTIRILSTRSTVNNGFSGCVSAELTKSPRKKFLFVTTPSNGATIFKYLTNTLARSSVACAP